MFSLDPFYPILPDTEWLARLLPQGIRLVQLRIKDQPQNVVSAEVAKAVALCRTHRCELVVNDYWQEAIAQRASFVHLGQEDLARADVPAIKSAGIRLGVSTHSDTELKAALAANPDYVALGPIYATTLKALPWAPQGLLRLAEWRAKIVRLVHIGPECPCRGLADTVIAVNFRDEVHCLLQRLLRGLRDRVLGNLGQLGVGYRQISRQRAHVLLVLPIPIDEPRAAGEQHDEQHRRHAL